MDVTLPIGVATVAGTPPAGGVPDVLARPAGADGTLPPDAFAALLATLGLGGVDATDGERAADDGVDTSPDGSPEAASGALVVEALGLLPQPTVPPIVPTAAAGSGDATAVLPPTPEDPVAAGSLPQPNTEAPGGTVASPAGAVPAAELSAPAETAVHAVSSDQARRTGASDIAAATPSPTKGPAPAAAEHSLAAVAEAAADSPVSIHRDAREEPPVGAHVPSQRPQDAARIERVAEAPEQPKPALPADAAAPTIDEATALLRRREPVPAQPDPASGVRHATGAEPMTNAPRPTTGSLPAPPSDASTAYRYAEAAMLPETSRPVGRLPDGGEMRLEVSPEGLGPIEIRVAVRADAVQASLWTQQDHARAALEAHRPMLADALGRSSLRLEEFTVGVGQHHHTAQDDDRAPRRWATPLAAEPVAASTTSHAPARAHGLSLRA